MRAALPRLHAITDERVARRADVQETARGLAVVGGAQLALHARGRELSGREHYALADCLALKDFLGSPSAPSVAALPPARLFVNDRLDIALAARATGVHLGHGSFAPADARPLNPEWWIGMSVHDLDEAVAAQTAGADYLLVGPVYATPTHPEATLLGVHGLAEIARVGLPAIAIGGVTPERVPELRAAGAYGVAAIRALWDAAEPGAAAEEFIAALGS